MQGRHGSGCLEEETINHVLFECQHAQGIWRCAHVPNLQINPPLNTLEDNITQVLQLYKDDTIPLKLRLLPIWLIWMIWKSRNEFIFRKRNVHPNEDVKRGQEGVAEWIVANDLQEETESNNVQQQGLSSDWLPPPIDWYKCNFDSTFQGKDQSIGVGWIVRDHLGRHIKSGSSRLRKVSSSLQAEAMGMLHAAQNVWSLGLRNVLFESDNKELVSTINTRCGNVEIGNILVDIWYWIRKLPLCSLSHINRERNHAADTLAKKAVVLELMYNSFTVPPIWLIDAFYYPFTV